MRCSLPQLMPAVFVFTFLLPLRAERKKKE
jgi:hypothetical protein